MGTDALLDTLIDSLTYYKRGTFQIYDRCCRRAFDYFGIKSTEDHYKKWKWQLLFFLRDFAFLDLTLKPNGINWECCLPALVEVDFDSYFLIAAARSSLALEKELGRSLERTSVFWTQNSLIPAEHREIRLVRVPRRLVESVADSKVVSHRVTHQAQWRLLSALPPLSKSISSLAEEVGSSFPPLSILGIDSRYDFSRFQWIEEQPKLTQSGLFRRPHENRRPEFLFQSFSLQGERKVWRVVSEEWCSIVGAHLMGVRIPITYKPASSELGFPQGLLLPGILRRLLVLGNLSKPRWSDGHVWFSKIKPSVVERLCEICPTFLRRTI